MAYTVSLDTLAKVRAAFPPIPPAPRIVRAHVPNECHTCEGYGEITEYRGVSGEGMDAEPFGSRCDDCGGSGRYAECDA